MNLEIKTSFIGKSHDFLKNKPDRLNKKRIDKRVNDFSMLIPWVLIKNYLILDKEM